MLSGVALLAGAGIIPQSRPVVPATEKASGYVDPAICAGCHQDIAKTYLLTGMGRSLYRPTRRIRSRTTKPITRFNNDASGLTYTMVEHDGKFYQRRSEKGFDGQETNVAEEQIDYVIGSGNHAHSYLHRGPDGRLIELPVSWYVENSGYWAMSPAMIARGRRTSAGRSPASACSVTTACR